MRKHKEVAAELNKKKENTSPASKRSDTETSASSSTQREVNTYRPAEDKANSRARGERETERDPSNDRGTPTAEEKDLGEEETTGKWGRRPDQEVSRRRAEQGVAGKEGAEEIERGGIQMHMSGGGGASSRMMPPKQLLTIILIVFSTLSFIKLLLLTSSSSSAASSSPHSPAWDAGGANGTGRTALAAKELALLRSLVAARAPCRLLVFGLSPQLLALAALNSGAGGPSAAATAFVTDSAEDADAARRVLLSGRHGAAAGASVAVHRARYRDAAAEAWPLLRRARGSPACQRPTGTVRKSGCPLALTSLPRVVLDARWDVVVVDGPSGAAPGEPGRMGTIYTAAALARAAAAAGGSKVDVAVHDVDRTVERWYAWEYLCEDNLVAAKGRLWHFRIAAGGPPDAFCTTGPVQIL